MTGDKIVGAGEANDKNSRVSEVKAELRLSKAGDYE